jgi:ubiquinone/menaquinone biosynthesis C-methylase UbiE
MKIAPEAAMSLKETVRAYWELNPCGASPRIVGTLPRGSREWFDEIEEHRYRVEPFIHAVAQFTRHRGKRVLEVGVGTGTDFLQWVRAGADCVGVDVTEEAVQLTRARMDCYGLAAQVIHSDAANLPFPDASFDLVYSWGVVHHCEDPGAVLREIRRVLRPGGTFIGMMYRRRSLVAFKLWVWHGLMRGRPWRTFADVIWHHMESVGTKAYTAAELRQLFAGFSDFSAQPILTPYDTKRLPRVMTAFLPDSWGWFTALTATR